MTRSKLLPLLLLSMAALPACRGVQEGHDPVWLVRHGYFAEAVETTERMLEEDPDDPRLQDVHRRAQAAFLLAEGRQYTFQDEAEEALALFLEALELQPDSPTIQSWVLKAQRQLAEKWYGEGYKALLADDLPAAEQHFETVLVYMPDHKEARTALARILLLRNYRTGLGVSYYQDGLRSFEEYLLISSEREFGLAGHFDDDNERARIKRERVGRLLAEERLANARSLEESGRYFAARTEYRLVLLADPDNQEARAGYDRMDRESRVTVELDKVQMDILRGESEKAEPRLETAAELTTAQEDAVDLRKEEVEEARLRELYERALSFERDYRYEEAVATYDQLLSETEYFDDAISRRDTLEWLMNDAASMYAQAEEAKTPQEEFELLEQIHNVVWPYYRDVEERLEALREQGVGSEDPGDAAFQGSDE